jgi:hypothetical protein
MFCVSLDLMQEDPYPAVSEDDLYIEIELQGRLLLVTASGRLALDPALRFLRQVFETAAERQVNKILVNTFAVQGELAAFERYALGLEAASYLSEGQMNLKLAVLGTPPAVTGFGVRVAQKRGVTTEVFSTLQEALKWLDESEPEKRA